MGEETAMDLTDSADRVREPGEKKPDFEEWDDPEEVLKGGPIRERLLDVIMQVREPTTVATIAERVDCDTETARDYLQWFAEMGVVREHSGRPVKYERNDSYLQWRRVEEIRSQLSDEEIGQELMDVLAEIEAYRDRFDAAAPGDVSLLERSRDEPVEETWKAVSEWKTLRRRAELLEAARRDGSVSSGGAGRVDA